MNSPTPTIEELGNESEYEKVLTLPYGDIAPFVIGSLRHFVFPLNMIWTVLAAFVFMTVWHWPGLRYVTEEPQIIKGLAAGLFLIPLALVPLHEGLHILPFRLAGAKDIRMGADLRQGIVYITAHQFVAGSRLFSAVALLPFAMITAGAAILMIFVSPWWQWVLSLAIVAHTTMCAGDAALLAFMNKFHPRQVFTWDDADKKEAYYYARKSA